MKKSTFISVLALLIAAAGAVVALLAYFSRKKCVLCDDFDDFEDNLMAEEPNDVEYYAAEMDGGDEPQPDGTAPISEGFGGK